MIICGTGHRPNKIGGYSYEAYKKLLLVCEKFLSEIKPEKVISGMALGWDQALAEKSIKMGIPVISAIPCKGQELVWPEESQAKYNKILKYAEKVIYVSKEKYSPYLMQKRNEWMVDNSDLVLAIWDGSKGGTYNCIKYAELKDKKIINTYDFWKSV